MLWRLAGGHYAIVATGTWRCDTAVVEPSAGEGHGALVTRLAGRTGDDMISRLAERGNAIVAAGAAANDASMAEFSGARR